MARPQASSESKNDHQNASLVHDHSTTILRRRQPIASITSAHELVYLGIIIGATILLCYVATLIFQLLKPLSDLVSGAGTGIGTACSRIGLGVEASIAGVTAGFTGLLSVVVPPMVSFKCSLINCDLAMPYLPDGGSKMLFFHTTNLTARLKYEAREILNLNGHIQSLSKGAMLEAISENSATFSDLSRKTAFDYHLPVSLRKATSDRFASLAKLSRQLECAFIALRRAGQNTKATFLREMNHLEHVLDPIWIFPTLSRDRTLRKQLERSQDSVDSTLDNLEKAVNEAMNIAHLLNDELDHFDHFLRDQSDLLETDQTHVQRFLTLMGFPKGLQENQERMMFLIFNVHEAQEHFMDIGTCCANIGSASGELKKELNAISPSNVPDKDEDSSPVAVRKAIRTYIQKLGEAPA